MTKQQQNIMAEQQQIEQQPHKVIPSESNTDSPNEAEAIQGRLRELDEVMAEAERKKSLLSGVAAVASQVGEDGQISPTEAEADDFLRGTEQQPGE